MNCRSIITLGIKYRCAANNRRHLKKLEAAVVIAMIKESMIGYKCLSEKKIQRKLTRQPGLQIKTAILMTTEQKLLILYILISRKIYFHI